MSLELARFDNIMLDKGKSVVKAEDDERTQKILHFESYFKNI
jgi:hypothetical protein